MEVIQTIANVIWNYEGFQRDENTDESPFHDAIAWEMLKNTSQEIINTIQVPKSLLDTNNNKSIHEEDCDVILISSSKKEEEKEEEEAIYISSDENDDDEHEMDYAQEYALLVEEFNSTQGYDDSDWMDSVDEVAFAYQDAHDALANHRRNYFYRRKKSNKHEKPPRFVKANRLKTLTIDGGGRRSKSNPVAMPRYDANRSTVVLYGNPRISNPTTTVTDPYPGYPTTTTTNTRRGAEQDRQLQQALAASRREYEAQQSSGTALALDFSTMESLMTRDLTPEDYELLLRLDETVAKQYLTMEEVNAKSEVLAYKPEKQLFEGKEEITERHREGEEEEEMCIVCLDALVEGESVRRVIACGHVYHSNCLEKWLMESSVRCPMNICD